MERSFRNLFGEKMEILHTKRQLLEKLQCQSDESETDMITDNQNGSRGNRCLSYTAVIHKNEELFQHSSSFILAYQYVVDISSQWFGE